MRRERLISFFDNLAEIVLLVLAIFVLLIYGSMQDYYPVVIGSAALIVLVAWLLRFLLTGAVYWVKTGLIIPLAVLIGISILHVIPFPAPLGPLVSPRAASLWKTLLGEKQPFFHAIAIFPYQAYAGMYQVIYYAIIFFVIANMVYEKEFVHKYVGVIVSVGAVLGALWLVQFVAKDFGDTLVDFLNCREDKTSLYFNRDYYLWFLTMPFFVTIGLLCADFNRERKALFACAFIIFSLAVLLSGKVTLYQSLICGAVFYCIGMLLTSRLSKVLKVIAAALILAGGGILLMRADAVVQLLPDVMRSGMDEAGTKRIAWGSLWALIGKAGFIGAGAGIADHTVLFGTLSGTTLEIVIAEFGIVGCLALLSFLLVYFWKNLRMLKTRKDPFVRTVAIGGMSGLTALLSGGLVEHPFASPAVMLNGVLLAALVFVLLRIRFVDVSEEDDGTLYFDIRVIKLRPIVWVLLAAGSIGVIYLVAAPLVHMQLALYNYRKGIYKLPVESYASAVNAPYSSILGFTGNETYVQRKERCLLKAVELDPRNPLYRFELGRFYRHTGISSADGRAEKAQEAFTEARALDPFNPAYAPAGAAQLQAADARVASAPAAGIPAAQEAGPAAEKEKMMAEAMDLLKRSRGSKDTLVKALEACRKVVSGDPALAEQVLAACAQRTQDYDLLKTVVQDLSDGPEILALFLYNRNAWEKNVKKFNKDMWDTPEAGKYPYYAALAEMAVQTGDFRGAITLMEGYVSKCPDNPDANYWIAEKSSYYPKHYTQDFTETFFHKALTLAPDNIRYQIGFCKYLYARKRYQNAADALLKLADKAGTNPEVFFLLGQCYEQLSSPEQALQMYEKVLAVKPDHIEAKSKVKSLKK